MISAGHIWVVHVTRMCDRGGVTKCKIVAIVRTVGCTGGAVSFFENICGDKKSFYSQVLLHFTRTFDLKVVPVIFDSENHVYEPRNFKTPSP